jgi:hypothetical protein
VSGMKKELMTQKIEGEEATSFVTNDKKRKYTKRVNDIDDFDIAVTRKTIHSFYAEEICAPTFGKLRTNLAASI